MNLNDLPPSKDLEAARISERTLTVALRGATRDVHRLRRHGRDAIAAERERDRLAFELIRARRRVTAAETTAANARPVTLFSTARLIVEPTPEGNPK
jgi:hypothetical protein